MPVVRRRVKALPRLTAGPAAPPRPGQIIELIPPPVVLSSEPAFDIVPGVRPGSRMESELAALGVEKDGIVNRPVLAGSIVVRVGAPPHNFTPKILPPEHRIQRQPQEMAGRRVAVQIQAAGRFQYPAQLHQARRHHHQVGHHIVAAYPPPQVRHHLLDQRRHPQAADDFLLESPLRLLRPLPSVAERLELRRGILPRPVLKQDIVVGPGVKGRVQINQVHRFVGQVIPQQRQIVAIVKSVGHNQASPTKIGHIIAPDRHPIPPAAMSFRA